MSAAIMPVDQTLTENEFLPPTASTAPTGDVLSWEGVISAVSAWAVQGRHVIRVQGAAPNGAVVKTIKKLCSLTDLEAGWDSYEALPVRKDVIRHTARWIPVLFEPGTPEPAVVPRAIGGLQLEWHRKGVDLEVIVDAPEEIRFLGEDLISREEVGVPLAGHEDLLSEWIKRISD